MDRGIAAFKASDMTAAEELFRDAVNVDPANGVAYYYLARLALRRSERDAALGFLDKADALLGNDAYWKEQIVKLQQDLQP